MYYCQWLQRGELGLVMSTVYDTDICSMLVGQIPNGIIIQKIAPRIWLPSMAIVWVGLTAVSAACKTYTQLCVVRFFQGLAESSTYAGCVCVMGSW